jgi:hypothetical protein
MSDPKISYHLLTHRPLGSSIQPQHSGKLPRVTRLMALAIRFEQLLHSGTVWDYADLARLGCVSRARITQIMSLLHLAPDIQEELLLLPPTTDWRDGINEHNMRAVAASIEFSGQRDRFESLRQKTGRGRCRNDV